jgi:hypothetical protein
VRQASPPAVEGVGLAESEFHVELVEGAEGAEGAGGGQGAEGVEGAEGVVSVVMVRRRRDEPEKMRRVSSPLPTSHHIGA